VSYEQPYAGIKIVDLSQAIAGPYAASLLALQGAEVIKVEPPRGDWMRWIGHSVGDHSTLSIIVNLGKRSLVVDLKTEEGLQIVRQLIAEADIFIESFRPGVITRLGLGYEAVSTLNPRIIYLSVSGFGQAGPLRERPGTDAVMQAFSGFMSVNKGNDGIPHRAGIFHADLSTALYNLQALQAALWARQSAGKGCYIENSLLRAATAFHNMNLLTEHLAGPDNRPGAYPSETFATADGFINLAVIYDHEFPILCDLLGLAEFRDHPDYQTAAQRYARRDVLEPVLRDVIRQKSTDYWCERLTEGRLLHERVHTYTEFLSHPQPAASGALTWIEHPHAGKIPLANVAGIQPYDPDQPRYAPAVGEHSVAILRELGYSADRIDDLVARGVVGTRHTSRNEP
jgi:crotonobetainyl-CoA:carnitine CoA-transferase CaiB-like acyl-CoA transferase